ncbi:hypothetical protein ACFL9T_13060 [Thermodesulfobacteriota bacterium]
MAKKRNLKKKKAKHSATLSSEEEVLLASLLSNSVEINPGNIQEKVPSPRLAQALLEKLPPNTPEIVPLIQAVSGAFREKKVQKAVARAVFRLKKKGISVPIQKADDSQPVFHSARQEASEPYAFLGPIDGMGNRAVFLAMPQIPKDVDLGMGIINDEQGILNFIHGRYSKKRLKEVQEHFFSQVEHMVETSLPHVATVLERAFENNQDSVDEASRDYLSLRPWILENVTMLDRAVIYDSLPIDTVENEILTESMIEKLLDQEFMLSWIIEPEQAEGLMEGIAKIEESPLHLTEEQKANRVNEIKESTLIELFPEQKRSILKTRLEEMAYLFYKQDAQDYALLSLASALSLEQKDSPIHVNAFLKAMIERSISYYEEAGKQWEGSTEKEEESSKIIVP